jgi:glycosyltransferase involved in cell wall biosynthesis
MRRSLASLPVVLHVLSADIARGAQRYASALRGNLNGGRAQHLILTLFEGRAGAMRADIAVDAAMGRQRRLGLAPAALSGLRRAIREISPAVIVAHGSEPLKYASLARVGHPARLIYYKIGIAHPSARRFGRRAVHAFLLSRADHVAGVSRECLDEAAEFGVPRKRLTLIPNGRDPDEYRPDSEASRSTKASLVFVGHLAPTKRPELFVWLVEQLRAQGLDFDARIVGDGALAAALVPAAHAAGVELLGRRHDVPEILRSSDVFAFTSVPEGEGMPGVFIEAGLSGLPVVATDVPGARTVIDDGVSGFVVQVDNREALVRRVGQLLRDPELRRAMGAAARQKCVAEFTLNGSVARFAELIDAVLS